MKEYRQVLFRDESMTGSRYEVLEALTRSVAAFCRSDSRVRRFYIGIASGIDAVSAMDRRYDDYKSEEGINEMITLYSSSSQRFSREVEKYLERMFRERNANIINRTGGGGGRPSSGPKYYVYLAVKRLGKKR